MPPARPATAPRRHPRPAPRKAPRLIARPPKLRVRWERVGRIGLLVVLTVVVGLYVEHTLSYVATRSQSERQQAIVTKLTRQNAQLAKETKALNTSSTIISQARALGMVRPNERPYVVTGQPAP